MVIFHSTDCTMNDSSSCEITVFQNPECKPLEDLKLTIRSKGVTQAIPALDKCWIEEKTFLKYEGLNLTDLEGTNIIGAKERWLELTNFIIEDLEWLLNLPFYKFWCNIIYNPSIMDSIITFLQDAPICYAMDTFPDDYDIKENYDHIRRNILIVLARLVTNKESSEEYISHQKYADLLYNKYIFTVPITMDICQQYGRDNRKIVEKILDSVFTLQPLYKDDLVKAAEFILQALRNVEERFEDCPIDQNGQAVLLSERGMNLDITLPNLEDTIIYLLDTVSTVHIFIDIYSASVNNFKTESFVTKLISIYGNSIPEMYKRLDDLALKDETIVKYMELKHRLDVVRIEIINTYRTIIFKCIEDIIENRRIPSSSELEEIVEDFLANLMHMLSEKEFVMDYYNSYPVTDDFQILIDLYPDLDTVKCEFIVNSIFMFLDEPTPLTSITKKKTETIVAGSSSCSSGKPTLETENKASVNQLPKTNSVPETEVSSLISEIKDILCDLGEGFLQICLKHYNYNKEAVINAVLEDSLPVELKNLDRNLPSIPPDPEEASAVVDAAVGVQRLNIYDNDEFDIMTKDVIDTSRIHKGKRKDKYKNINELLNDKSHITQTKEIYSKYGIVISEYDDEYDDTYDDQDIGTQDDIIEEDARPFTIPRVLRKQVNNYEDLEEENELDHASETQPNRDGFVQDPALLRAKAEERRFAKQRRNVVGNQKGQGQTKEVLDNRLQKNKNKSSRANHNRRAGSQWKRNQSMVPS